MMVDQILHDELLEADETARASAVDAVESRTCMTHAETLLSFVYAFRATALVCGHDPDALFEQMSDHAATMMKVH